MMTSDVVSRVVFVTGNSNKLREVVAILGKIPGFEVCHNNHSEAIRATLLTLGAVYSAPQAFCCQKWTGHRRHRCPLQS
ncbi:hypothetical protein V5799_012864 [Amblyomma americanum]|uniref:Inosine triphosphate pyrophosphatase n=1 Tax=Amblyomma americanum TaxID=6943 RepID=A0AAQ4E7G2_AMBAM